MTACQAAGVENAKGRADICKAFRLIRLRESNRWPMKTNAAKNATARTVRTSGEMMRMANGDDARRAIIGRHTANSATSTTRLLLMGGFGCMVVDVAGS